VSCDEGRLVAFLNGQLSDEDEHAVDEHLLTCDACWRAVRDDRDGRRALDRLRQAAPTGLGERVASSIRLAERPGDRDRQAADRDRRLGRRSLRAMSGRPRRLVAAAAAALALLGGTLAWMLHHPARTDPPQIARVVAMMSPEVANQPALRTGERFDFAGQALAVRSYQVEGDIVLVATSATPFPMPSSSHMLAGSSPAAWMAAEGPFAMYGLNRPAGSVRASMFLVAAMPMAQLPQVAARLHLI
jgi:anti-sigma factor RsiW